MTTATGTITLTIPLSLCPMSLSKNGRAHWRQKHRDFQAQKQWVLWRWRENEMPWKWTTTCKAWPAAVMHIEWQYNRGRPPDDDNAVARLAAVRDAFEDIGLVGDDRHIRIGTVTFTRIPRSDDPCAVVTLERA